MESTSIYAALAAVQSELKAPKGQMNTFGGYRYRSCEDILEAVKPILKAHNLLLTLSDEPKVLEGWHYIEATAKLESLDSDTIARWGLLQLYQKVDEAATDAQVKEQAKVSLEYYNRVLQQLKFTSLGVNSLRAGQLLLVNINDLDGDPFRKYVMLEKVSHTWENDLHTMELEAKAL